MLVSHSRGSYAVMIGEDTLERLSALVAERHPGHRAVVICDETVHSALGNPLPSGDLLSFVAGEAHKSIDTWLALTNRLLDLHCDRNTVVIAMGGGVTTDLAGFVAATFLRGVPWVACPTTTLCMLDAAVGGKTGVNTAHGKNLVGAFHPPSAVVCDTRTLRTLPERSYREGLAEAVKHAATLDSEFGAWIALHHAEIAARDAATLHTLVRRSLELKAGIVMDDERESGRRAVLNAGHTVAHALERASGYTVAHGEAVAIGLVVETRVAERMRVAERGVAAHVAELLEIVGLPTRVPDAVDRSEVVRALAVDKKNRDGVVRAALLANFGEVAGSGQDWTFAIDPALVAECLLDA